MTKDEFNKEMTRLIQTFGERFWPPTRIGRVWENVQDLDGAWLRSVVNRMIDKFDEKINIVEAAKAERLARREVEKTAKIIADKEINYTTLEEILAKNQVKSLTDLIFKK